MNKRLLMMVGAGTVSLLTAYVPAFEGMVLRGYRDPIGIVTACAGHTATAVLGKPYTVTECHALLERDLVEHATGVMSCIKPPMSTGQKAAFISFAFNVGTAKFCSSTLAKKANSGDMAGACAELSRWVLAKGKTLPGLVKRRQVERDMCEGRING